jgi:hypothetical protein
MTMSSTVSKVTLNGDGVQTSWPFAFKVWQEADIEVILSDPTGADSVALDWSAVLAGLGGTVTYPTSGPPLPLGWKITIKRAMPFLQEVDLVSGTRWDPEVVETALDQKTAELQQLKEELSRSVKIGITSSGTAEDLLTSIYDARDAAQVSADDAAAQVALAEGQVALAAAQVALAEGHADDAEQSAIDAALAAASIGPLTKAEVEAVLTGSISTHTHADASTTAAGLIEIATDVEVQAGTSTSLAVTPAGVDAYHKAKNIVVGAAVPASGAVVDFENIPPDVKRITLLFHNLSSNGTSLFLVRVGAGSVLSSGYTSYAPNDSGSFFATNTTGFVQTHAVLATDVWFGTCVLNRHGDKWVLNGSINRNNAGYTMSSGVVTLVNNIDRIRVTTANGTDQFDSGTISISWEF